MINEIKNNIEIEIDMTNKLSTYIDKFHYSVEADIKMLLEVINSYLKKIRIINNFRSKSKSNYSYKMGLNLLNLDSDLDSDYPPAKQTHILRS